MMTSILPGNLSLLEHDLDSAIAARLDNVEYPISTLWDPWNCPVEVLPYLAWALSVDVWQSNWPEKTRRQVLADSFLVHRQKGTRTAVEQALKSLGIEVQLLEWFEQSPLGQRGTFKVNIYVDELGLSESLENGIHTLIDTVKNTRSHYTSTVYLSGSGGVNYAIAMQDGDDTTIYPYVAEKINTTFNITYALAMYGVETTTIYPN